MCPLSHFTGNTCTHCVHKTPMATTSTRDTRIPPRAPPSPADTLFACSHLLSSIALFTSNASHTRFAHASHTLCTRSTLHISAPHTCSAPHACSAPRSLDHGRQSGGHCVDVPVQQALGVVEPAQQRDRAGGRDGDAQGRDKEQELVAASRHPACEPVTC